jgi:ankyrin repeat protein
MKRIMAIFAALAISLTACAGDQTPTTDQAGVDASLPRERQMRDAITAANAELVQDLLAAGLAVDADLGGGATALHLAVGAGDAGIVEFLLAAGSPTEARTQSGETPLHLAAADASGAVVRLLIAAGADPEAPNPDFRNNAPLHYASRTGNTEAALALLAAGVDADQLTGPIALRSSSPRTTAVSRQRMRYWSTAWTRRFETTSGRRRSIGPSPRATQT